MVTTTKGSLLLGNAAQGLRAAGCGVTNRALGLARLDALYASLPSTRDPGGFLAAARECLDLHCDVLEQGQQAIPAAGPLLVVCNHPFGGADGLLLTEFVLARRPDLRVLGNRELARIPELAALLLPVEILGACGRGSAENLRGVRNALRWLQRGGTLLLFPAGEVASMRAVEGVTDQRWHALAGWLVRHSVTVHS